MFGDTGPLDDWGVLRLKQFLRGGGTVLVATDRVTGPCLKDAFGVRVTGEHLRAVGPEDKYLAKVADCPVVRGFDGDPALFKNVGQIATNLPSFLSSPSHRPRGAGLARPLSLSGVKQSRSLPPTIGRLHRLPRARPFALAGQGGFANRSAHWRACCCPTRTCSSTA